MKANVHLANASLAPSCGTLGVDVHCEPQLLELGVLYWRGVFLTARRDCVTCPLCIESFTGQHRGSDRQAGQDARRPHRGRSTTTVLEPWLSN